MHNSVTCYNNSFGRFFIRNLVFLLAFLLWDVISVGVSPTWASDPKFSSGSVVIVLTSQNNNFNSNFTVTFSPTLPASTTYYNILIGVTKFVIPQVNRIEFNFTKYSMSTTSFILNCKFGNQTVFSKLSINYMIVDNNLTDHQLIMYDYPCTVINQSSGYRSQKIQYTTTKLSNFNVSALKAQIFLQSFNLSNYNGHFHTFYSMIVQTNHTFVIQLITTNFNQFESIQFWLMVCDYSQMDQNKVYYQDIQLYLFNSLNGISNIIPSINNTLYMAANKLFFALSMFNFTKYSTVTLSMDISNPINLAQNYQLVNIDFLKMFAYFRVKKVCPASNYYSPSTGLCDTTCATPESFYDYTNFLCQACHYTCTINDCVSALANQCQSCFDSSRQGFPTGASTYSCPCATGYFQSGLPTCYNCGDYIPGCTNCLDGLNCSVCNSANGLTLNGTSCKCSDPTKVQIGDLCYSLIGCTAITMSGGIALCTQCSWARGFVFVDTYVCACQAYKSRFQINSGDYYCLYTCGDGYVSPDQECDDDNSINGDGCSDSCHIETNFTCTGALNVTSVCLYIIKTELKYLGTIRQIYINKAEIYFEVSPKDINLKRIDNMNLSNLIVTSIPNSKIQGKLYDISSQEALFSHYYLQVTIQYTQSIQTQEHDLYLNLTNQWQWMYDSSQSIFFVQGANAQISYDPQSQLATLSNIDYVVLFLVCLAQLISFISVFFDRLIGIELIITVQSMYYLLSAVQVNPVELVALEKSLQFSTGYNKLTSLIPVDYPQYLRTNFLPSYFEHQAYEKQFILNFNFSFAIFMLTLFVIFVFYLANKCQKIQAQTNQDLFQIQLGNQNGSNSCTIQSIYECLFNRVLVFISFWVMPQIIFAICVQTNQYQPDFYLFQDSINVLSSFISFLLLICMMLGLAYWYMKQNAQQAYEQKKGGISSNDNKNLLPLSFKICKMEYPLVYLMYQFIKFMIIALFLEYAIILYIILSLQILYFILIVIYRPYMRINPNFQNTQDDDDLRNQCFSIHNFTIAINQLILITFCFLILLWNQGMNVYDFSSSYPTIMVYMGILFLLLINILALLRLFYKKLGKLYCCQSIIQKIFKTQVEGQGQFQFQHMRKLYTKNDLDKLKNQQEQQQDEVGEEDENKSDKKSILKDIKKNKSNFVNWPQFQNGHNDSENSGQNYSKFPNKGNALNSAKNLLGKSKIIQDYTHRDISLLVSNPDSIDQSLEILNRDNKKMFKGLNWVKQSQIQPSLNSKSSSKVKEVSNSSSQSVLKNYLQSKPSQPSSPYVTDFVIRKSSNKKQAQLKKSGLQVLIQQKMKQASQSFLDPIKQQNDDIINIEQVKQRLRLELQQKTAKKKQLKQKKDRKESKEAKQLKQIKKFSHQNNNEKEANYMINSNQTDEKVNLLNKNNFQNVQNKTAKNGQENNGGNRKNGVSNKKIDPMMFFSFGAEDGI